MEFTHFIESNHGNCKQKFDLIWRVPLSSHALWEYFDGELNQLVHGRQSNKEKLFDVQNIWICLISLYQAPYNWIWNQIEFNSIQMKWLMWVEISWNYLNKSTISTKSWMEFTHFRESNDVNCKQKFDLIWCWTPLNKWKWFIWMWISFYISPFVDWRVIRKWWLSQCHTHPVISNSAWIYDFDVNLWIHWMTNLKSVTVSTKILFKMTQTMRVEKIEIKSSLVTTEVHFTVT